MVNYFL